MTLHRSGSRCRRWPPSAAALLVLGLAAPAAAVDYLDLPPERFPPAGWVDSAWEDPGGWEEVDVSTAGITPASTTVAADLQALMDAATGPTVFYLPPGDYDVEATLNVRSNVVIRGAGADQTRLLLGSGAGPVTFSGGWDPVIEDITADVPAGATSIPVADASGFAVGDIVRVEQALPAWAESWGARAYGQVVFVTGIAGNTLEIDMPLALPYSTAASPTANHMNLVENAGIERLYLERLAANEAETIFIKRAYNVFVRYLESYNTAKYHVYVARARRVLIHGNYMHHAWDYGGGGHGYGVDLMETSTRCLVYDNVFEVLRHSLIYATGANHCVVAYNFNVDIGNPDNVISDVCGHGHWQNHNLFEGNVAWWYFIDNVWGPAGPENTFFRNRALGQTASWHQGEGIAVDGDADRQNIVANLLDNDSTLWFGADVDDTYVEGNLLSGVAQWSTLSDRSALPPSLYLDQAPDFWIDGLAWPPFGPDVANASGNKIPAQLRWEQGQPVAGGEPPDAGLADGGSPADAGGMDALDAGAGADAGTAADAGSEDHGDAGGPQLTVFSPIAYSGDRLNYRELTPARWSVVEDQGDLRYFLNTSAFDPLSGNRMGEHTIIQGRSYDDFELSLQARSAEDLVANDAADLCLVFGYQDGQNYYFMVLNSNPAFSQLHRAVAGQRETIADVGQALIVDNAYHDIVLRRQGSAITLEVDGVQRLSAVDATFGAGGVGVGSINDSSYFDDIEVSVPPAADAGTATDAFIAVDSAVGADGATSSDAAASADSATPLDSGVPTDAVASLDRVTMDASAADDAAAAVDARTVADAGAIADAASPRDAYATPADAVPADIDAIGGCSCRASGPTPPVLALALALLLAWRRRWRRGAARRRLRLATP